MKKIFTCIFCAVWAISCFGETKIIEVSDAYESTTYRAPTNVYDYNSLCQILYLKSDLGTDTKAGKITAISFKNACNNGKQRVWDVYMSNTTAIKVSSFTAVTTTQKTFTGNKTTNYVTIPSSADWYTITLDTPFEWDGTSNVLITINDKSTTYAGSSESNCVHYRLNLTSGNNRVVSKQAASGSAFDPMNPPTSEINVGKADVPWIKFTIEESSEPIVVPTLNPSTNSLDLGTFMQGEIVSNTFTLSASDLTDDVTLTASDGLTVSPSSFTKEQLATAQTVTISSTSTFNFPYSSSVTIKSEGATDAKVTVSAKSAGDYAPAYTLATLTDDDNIGKYFNYTGKATIVSVSGSTMVISQSSYSVTLDFSAIGGSYAANGTVTNIKGKLTSSRQFKALEAFTYTPPAMTGVTIKEDADNSETLAEKAENVNVTLNRAAFQKNMFNTFCVPFDINEGLIGTRFAGCDIITLASSAYNDGVISLTFAECNQMGAGKPYLINPKNQDISFTFNGCNIQNVASGSVETDLVDFIGIVNPTDLPQSKEILFMGQNNELFWPTEAGTLKGMRCYFKVNFEGTPEGSAIAGAPVRMSIIKSNGITTDLPMMWSEPNSPIIMYKNQLFIIKDNKLINISGQTIQ